MTTSPVLTSAEAVRWLRLDEDHDDIGSAVKALHRLVQEGRLRPLRVGKSYKFTLAELEKFICAEVMKTPTPGVAPDAGDALTPVMEPSK